MGNLTEIFNNVKKNNFKAINKSIEDVGNRHHAMYMAGMMFMDDMDINQRLLSEIQNTVNSLYDTISDNYLIKKNAKDMIQRQCQNKIMFSQNFKSLTEKQLSEMVYQQAMKYYFRIEVKNSSDFNSYFDKAIQYRTETTFFKSDIERIIMKICEDIEIIIEDTRNIEFLMRNYKKLDGYNDKYYHILEQLAESIRNTVLRNDRFEQEYFDTVRQISSVVYHIFS